MLARNGEGPISAATETEPQGCFKFGSFEPPSSSAPRLGPATIIRAELIGSDTCTALGITSRSSTPVLALCRSLVEAEHDPPIPLEAFRGDVLCIRVRSIGECAQLETNGKGTGFITHRAVRAASPIRQNHFQIDTTGLTADQRGVYITMLCLAWRFGDGSVSGDMKELKTVLQNIIADFHGLTFNRVVPKLLDRYFEKRAGGRFYHPGVEKQLRIAREFSEKQSRNAKERWSQGRKSNGLADATAMPSYSHSHSHKETGGQLRVKKEEAGRIFVEFGTPEWEERSKHPPPGKSRWPAREFHFEDGVKHGWFFPKAVQPKNCG